MTIDLDGRVVAITGAAGGLGSAYAKLLAARGARLVLNDIGASRDGSGFDPTIIDGVVDAATQVGAEAVGDSGDMSDPEDANAFIAKGIATFGRIDALVNSGGLLRDRMFVGMSIDEFDAVIRGHLRSHFCPSQALAAHWRAESKAGNESDRSLVFTTSNAGLFAQPGQSNYAAAKAGIAGLAVTLADELERYGVRVNSLSPAARTRMTTAVPAMADMVAAPEDADAFDTFDPVHVAEVVAWLVSPQCDATGQTFFIRGQELKVVRGWRYADELHADDGWTADSIQAQFAGRDWERTPRA